MRGEFIDLGGRQIYCFAAGSRGDAEPLILIHGLLTSSHLWARCIPLLPAGRRILVVDLLGHGRSGTAPPAEVTISAHAHRTVRLLDALGIRTASILAHGAGCSVAMEMAHLHRDRVRRACLVSPIVVEPGPVGLAARLSLALTSILPGTWPLVALRRELERGYTDSRLAAHSVEQYLRPFQAPAGIAQLKAHRDAWRALPDWRQASARTDLPVTIIRGTADTMSREADVRVLADASSSASEITIDGMRHFVPEEAPERVVSLLTSSWNT